MSDIKVYFDKNGSFILQLLKGAQRGYDVSNMMNSLQKVNGGIERAKTILKESHCESSDFSRVEASPDEANDLFPCIIVVKKKLLTEWDKAEGDRLMQYKRLLNVYGWLPIWHKRRGLWPMYIKFISSEIKRIISLRKKIQSIELGFKKNLKGEFSFLNNSSTWIRLVDWNEKELSDAWDELQYFKNIGLFDYGSAQESLGYNVRIQKENYLKTPFGGHGGFVTPEIYGDEVEAKKILVGKSANKTNS